MPSRYKDFVVCRRDADTGWGTVAQQSVHADFHGYIHDAFVELSHAGYFVPQVRAFVELSHAPSVVAVFMSAHSKTPYITPSMIFRLGKG